MIPESILLLAGFALAHAAWSVSDTTPDELLVPLAVIEVGGQRTLQRFEAETQVAAVTAGKAAMAEATAAQHPWVFVHEGLARGMDGQTQDVLIVELWTPGMDAPLLVTQAFTRAAAGRAFRILGQPMVALHGRAVDESTTSSVRRGLRRGIDQHSRVAPLWAQWTADTTARGT